MAGPSLVAFNPLKKMTNGATGPESNRRRPSREIEHFMFKRYLNPQATISQGEVVKPSDAGSARSTSLQGRADASGCSGDVGESPRQSRVTGLLAEGTA